MLATKLMIGNRIASEVKRQVSDYLTSRGKYKEVHIFPKDISPKVNVIEWLEFELDY